MSRRDHQKGNVIFYVLIAISLLGALSFATSQAMRGSTDQLSAEKAKLYAAELIEYANIVSSAVAQLRLRGCSDTQISFYHTNVTGYANGSAPSDNSCHVFHINGGGVERISAPPEGMNSSDTPDHIWHIYEGNQVNDVGTTGSGDDSVDLILVVDELQEIVCTKINDLLSVSNPSDAPPQDMAMAETEFTGSYASTNVLSDQASELSGKSTACFLHKTPEINTFYTVLIAR